MSGPARRRWAALAAACALVACVFAAFAPALGAEFQTHWDDNYNLRPGAPDDGWRGLGAEELAWMATSFRLGHWIPLTWLSFAVDHALFGMDPFGYHLTNVLLHAANAVLVFLLVRAALRAAGLPAAGGVAPALVGALFFAVHPLRVESVAWVTERRDVLSAAFLLGTVLAWFRWRETGARRWYLAALALYVPALLAKAWGITLPAILLVLDVWPHARASAARLPRLLAEKVPFALLAAPAAVLAFLAQRASGAMDYAAEFGALQKAAQACYGLGFYVAKTVLPVGLLPVYALDTALDPTEPRFLAGFAFVAVAAAAAVALRRRAPWLAASLAIYAIAVSPVLGLTQSGVQLVADRYAYVATLPFAVLVAAGYGRLAARAGGGAAAAAATLVLAALAVGAFRQARLWHDSRTLFTAASERAPDEWYPWCQLGTMAFQDGDPRRAIELYDAALAADDRAWLAYESRGIARAAVGDDAGAVADWSRAIELYPHSLKSFANRGSHRMRAGDHAGARDDFERAVALAPDEAGAWLALGNARLRLGEHAGARAALERALELVPAGSPRAADARRLLAELP